MSSWDFTVKTKWDNDNNGIPDMLVSAADVHVLDLDSWILWAEPDTENAAITPPFPGFPSDGFDTDQDESGHKTIDYSVLTGFQDNNGQWPPSQQKFSDLSKLGSNLWVTIYNAGTSTLASNWKNALGQPVNNFCLTGTNNHPYIASTLTWTDPQTPNPTRLFDLVIWQDRNHSGAREGETVDPQKKLTVSIRKPVLIDRIEYRFNANDPWRSVPTSQDTFIVPFAPPSTTVDFRAIKNSTDPWPSGKPVWGGNCNPSQWAAPNGDCASVTFGARSNAPNDKTIAVECGNTKTINVTAAIMDLKLDGSTFNPPDPPTVDSDYAYISATPEMPPLTVRLLPQNIPGTACFVQRVEYRRPDRNDDFYFSTGYLSADYLWDIQAGFAQDYRGGKATLSVDYETQDDILLKIFHIRAYNPPDDGTGGARAYIDANCGVHHWYAYAIAMHESKLTTPPSTDRYYNQFNPPHVRPTPTSPFQEHPGPAWDDIVYCPNRYDGTTHDGWGMMMLTNPTPQGEQLWNWHDNVLEGISRLNEKRTVASQYFEAVLDYWQEVYEDPPDYEEFADLTALETATIQLYREWTVSEDLPDPHDPLGRLKTFYSCWEYDFDEFGEMYWYYVPSDDQDYVALVCDEIE